MLDRDRGRNSRSNEQRERWGYGLAGAALLAWGMRRGPIARVLAMAVGSGLLYRVATGESPLARLLQILQSGPQRKVDGDIDVRHSVTVDAEPDEIYRFWRKLENLPRFMQHLESVQELDSRRSRWSAVGPAGTRVEWEAEIVREDPGHELAWESLPGSTVSNRGVVTFRPTADGRATEIEVRMQYRPPAGRLGAAVARLFGEEPQLQIEDDLQRLRRIVDAGELRTIHAGTQGGGQYGAGRLQ